jgi:hypothetical protein
MVADSTSFRKFAPLRSHSLLLFPVPSIRIPIGAFSWSRMADELGAMPRIYIDMYIEIIR